MGVYGFLKFAYKHGIVRHRAVALPPTVVTPIAVDLWNVMYTLMERFYPKKAGNTEDAVMTARCFYTLLRLLDKRALYPVFVMDRGVSGGEVRGAKAIAANTMRTTGGSGRLTGFDLETEGEETFGYRSTKSRRRSSNPDSHNGQKSGRWSSRSAIPKLSHGLCIHLIRFLGYPYINTHNMEADDACANLFHTGAVINIYSTDMDLLLMGCDLILDIVPLFPPTLRCRDVLECLNLSYPQFLARFVRCHTDLHQMPILKSVEQVINNERRRQRSNEHERREHENSKCEVVKELSDNPDDPTSDDDAHVDLLELSNGDSKPESPAEYKEWRRRRPRLSSGHNGYYAYRRRRKSHKWVDGSGDIECRKCGANTSVVATKNLEITTDERSDVYNADNKTACKTGDRLWCVRDADKALDILPVPRTRHDVLERKFVKHVVSLLTPENRGHLSILRRVPILQDHQDLDSVVEIIARFIQSEKESETLANLFCKFIPKPQDYDTVIDKYWNS
ncbi:tegument host shutoff protein [Spheniscid alphaherpesvirus 1]|uniref:Virion host shutoff protein n=1 Tax=Spheniscid alphaherpesvirus 1 TaxID=2560777 RepID=A0A1R3TAH8_9ALPH|nr:tegument host shutoff protein [Spheniscid alphaherpesvirus 1]